MIVNKNCKCTVKQEQNIKALNIAKDRCCKLKMVFVKIHNIVKNTIFTPKGQHNIKTQPNIQQTSKIYSKIWF